MKAIFLFFLAFPVFSFCQNEKAPSKIEAITAKPGVLLKKEFIDLGKISTAKTGSELSFQLLKVVDLKNDTSIAGLKLQVLKLSVFLDLDEADELLLALSKMKEIINQAAPTDYTEYVFTSRAGFKTIVSSSPTKKWSLTIEIGKDAIAFDDSKTEETINKTSDILLLAKQKSATPDADKKNSGKTNFPAALPPPVQH